MISFRQIFRYIVRSAIKTYLLEILKYSCAKIKLCNVVVIIIFWMKRQKDGTLEKVEKVIRNESPGLEFYRNSGSFWFPPGVPVYSYREHAVA